MKVRKISEDLLATTVVKYASSLLKVKLDRNVLLVIVVKKHTIGLKNFTILRNTR